MARPRNHYKFRRERYEKAKYYPRDKEYLLEFEETLNHYETYI